MPYRSLVAVALSAGALVACSSSSSNNPTDAPLPQIDASVPPGSDAAVCSAPMTMCTDTCTNLANDANNCGACGHVCGCGSTTCTNGACDPNVIADQQDGPNTLALDAATGTLFWGTDANAAGGVMPNLWSMSTAAGGKATILGAGLTAIRGLAFDASHVYVTRNAFNIVEQCPFAGGCGGSYSNAQENGAAGIVSDGTRLYWANGGSGLDGGDIRSAPIGAPPQTATTLTTGQAGADGIAVDATNVYWVTHNASGSVMMIAKTAVAGTPVQLVPKQANPHALVYANGGLFWTDQGTTANTGSVQRYDLTTKVITTYASNQPGPASIAVDANFVYWTDAVANTVTRAAIDGGSAPIPVVPHDSGQPLGLAISNACLYYTDYASNTAAAGAVLSHDLQ